MVGHRRFEESMQQKSGLRSSRVCGRAQDQARRRTVKKGGAEVAAPKGVLVKKSFSPEYIGKVESQLHTT